MLCLTIMTSKTIEIILISPASAGIYCLRDMEMMKKSKNIKMIYDQIAREIDEQKKIHD